MSANPAAPLRRLGEALVFLLLVAWTMLFPLATLISFFVTLPLFALISPQGRPMRAMPARA